MNTTTKYIALISVTAFLFACGGGSQPADSTESTGEKPKSLYAEKKEASDPMKNKGIGPVQSLELGDIDQGMADEGKMIYDEKCTACHKVTERYIGPAPAGIMERRTPVKKTETSEQEYLFAPKAHGQASKYTMFSSIKERIVQEVEKKFKYGSDVLKLLKDEKVTNMSTMKPKMQVSSKTDQTAREIEQKTLRLTIKKKC